MWQLTDDAGGGGAKCAELEGALRAQAELDNINNKLYASFGEEVPEEYRDLVQEYYRVLSENQGSENQAQ